MCMMWNSVCRQRDRPEYHLKHAGLIFTAVESEQAESKNGIIKHVQR